VLVPQITGRVGPVGLVTVKESTQAPVADVTEVTKLVKSSLGNRKKCVDLHYCSW